MAQEAFQEALEKVFRAKLERREFMRRLGLTAIAVAGLPHIGRFAWAQESLPPASQVVAGKSDALIVHNADAGVLETPLELLREHRITPFDIMYVRNNQVLDGAKTLEPLPLEGWTVELTGLVKFPKVVLATDLANMEGLEVEMVLQCSGNGRSNYARAVQTRGTQWGQGGMGNVRFRGVPLRTLIDSFDPPLDIHPAVEFLTLDGADQPEATAADFQHSVPLDYALEHAILATEMNGEPIPAIHGGPVRFIIPGYYGTMNLKWLTAISFDAAQTNNYNQIPRYRIPNEPIEPGTDIDYTFENSTPNWNQKVNSVIFSPLTGTSVDAGSTEVSGVAWNDGEVFIDTVEVTTDGGKTWQVAELEVPESPYAWHHWRANVELPSGTQRISARAIDKLGRSQPLDGTIFWNPSGYEWHGVDTVEVNVS